MWCNSLGVLRPYEALKEANRQDLKPCPFCGAEVKVHGPMDWKPTFYDPDSGGDQVSINCECGLSFSIGSYDYNETYAAWNRRAGEEDKHETD